MTFKKSVEEASPIKIHDIGKKTHISIELGMLIRGMVIVAMVVAGYMNFMVRIDRMEVVNKGLKKQLVVRDSLVRRDIQATLNTLHKDLTTRATEMGITLDADIKAVVVALASETATMMAATQSNSEKIAIELENLKSLLVSVNRTTHAELRPAIDNVQTALDIQTEALNQRISLIEGQIQEQVKRSFLGRFSKK